MIANMTSNLNGNKRKGKTGSKKEETKGACKPFALSIPSLDATVKIPSTLQAQDLNGCPLDDLRELSVDQQQRVVTNYANTLRSLAGKNKDLQLNDKRRKELFSRCLRKVRDTQQRDAETSSEQRPSSGMSVSDAIRAAAQNSSITLPTTKFKLEQSSAVLFHSLDPGIQQEALIQCDEAVMKALQSGCTIDNPVQLFMPILQNLSKKTKKENDSSSSSPPQSPTLPSTTASNPATARPPQHLQSVVDTPVTLPKTKFRLELSAAIVFHCMDLHLQQRALMACDEAALKVIQKGVPIRNPVEFFTGVLRKLLQGPDLPPAPSPPNAIPAKENVNHKNNQQQDQRTTSANTTKPTSTVSAFIPPSKKKGAIQILQKNVAASEPLPPNNSSTTTTTATRQSISADAERTIALLSAELKDQTRQCQQFQKNALELQTMCESEQNRLSAYKERIETLERVNQHLQEQIVQKEDHLGQQLAQIQAQQVEEREEYKFMVQTVAALSKELCHAQQEKRELERSVQAEKAVGQEKESEIQRLKAALKRSELLRPTPRNGGVIVPVDTRRQQREAPPRNTSSGAKKQNPSKPSLADFVLGEREPGSVQILRQGSTSSGDDPSGSPPAAVAPIQLLRRWSEDQREGNHLESTLLVLGLQPANEADLTACLQAPPPEPENRAISFHGIDHGYDDIGNAHEEDGIQVGEEEDKDDGEDCYDETAEFDFLLASFGEDEIQIESEESLKRVTRTLRLHFDRNHEVVPVHLILTIPEGYPASNTPVQVEASLSHETNPSIEARKVTMDALPDLIKVCAWEARGSIGSREALFSVLQTADQWVLNEWHGIQAKRLPSDENGKACQSGSGNQVLSLTRTLLSIHHLVDAERIGYVKQTANHYKMGGYLKLGYPGYVLIEGLEDNCAFFLESIIQQQNKMRNSKRAKTKVDSAHFSVAGKVTVTVDDLESDRLLPKKLIEIDKSKEGMECFEEFCQRVDLAKYLVA